MTRFLPVLPLLVLFACDSDPQWLTDWSCTADQYATADMHLNDDYTNVTCVDMPDVCTGNLGFEGDNGIAGECLETICPNADEQQVLQQDWYDGRFLVDCDGFSDV